MQNKITLECVCVCVCARNRFGIFNESQKRVKRKRKSKTFAKIDNKDQSTALLEFDFFFLFFFFKATVCLGLASAPLLLWRTTQTACILMWVSTDDKVALKVSSLCDTVGIIIIRYTSCSLVGRKLLSYR
jgi:hypothetical protein